MDPQVVYSIFVSGFVLTPNAILLFTDPGLAAAE